METKNMTNDEKTPQHLRNEQNQKIEMKMEEPKVMENIEQHLVIKDENENQQLLEHRNNSHATLFKEFQQNQK